MSTDVGTRYEQSLDEELEGPVTLNQWLVLNGHHHVTPEQWDHDLQNTDKMIQG